MHWAAARMQAVFRGKRQRVVMRLWKSRQYMAASGVQTAWRIYVEQRRRLDEENEQLTTWMLDMLDFGYSRDPNYPRTDNRIAHRLALLARLRPAKDGSASKAEEDQARTAEKKRVVSTAALVRKQQAAVAAVPVGVYDSRKAQRAKTTTTKVWTLASRSQKKHRTKTDLTGRAAWLVSSGAAERGRDGGSVFMGPSPKVTQPRILIHIPKDIHARRKEAEAEAERLGAEIDALAAASGDSDDGHFEGDEEEEGGAAAAGPGKGRRGRRGGGFAGFGATARSGAGTRRSEYDNSGQAEPDLNPLEAPTGTKFDRRDKFGPPSVQEVLDDMRLVSDALQWHQERRTREERRRAAYALRSAESKATVEATESRMMALRGEGVVETVRRLRSFVTGVTEIQAELRERDKALRKHVEEHERRLQRGRAALRKFDRSAREALRRAGGLLDAAELEALLALLPSAQVMRAETAVSRGRVGEWDLEAPGRRKTIRQSRLSGLVGADGMAGFTGLLEPDGSPSEGRERARNTPGTGRGFLASQDRRGLAAGARAPGGFEGLFAGPADGAESLPRTPAIGAVRSRSPDAGSVGDRPGSAASQGVLGPSRFDTDNGDKLLDDAGAGSGTLEGLGRLRIPTPSGSVSFAAREGGGHRLAMPRQQASSSLANRPGVGVPASHRSESARPFPRDDGSESKIATSGVLSSSVHSRESVVRGDGRRAPVAVFPTVTGAVVAPRSSRPASSSSSFAAAFLGTAGRARGESGMEALASGLPVMRPPSTLGATFEGTQWGRSEGRGGTGEESARASSGGRSSTVASLHRVAPRDAAHFPSRRRTTAPQGESVAAGRLGPARAMRHTQAEHAPGSPNGSTTPGFGRARSWRRGDVAVRRPDDQAAASKLASHIRPLTASGDESKSPGKGILVKSNRPRSPGASVKFVLPSERPSTAE